MVIPGGDTPLLEEERNALTNYLDNGGHVIIFGGNRSEADQVDLAADPALNDYLWSNFGLRFNDDVVLDFQQAYQSAYSPIATDFATHPITENLDARPSILMNFTHSLSVSDTPPENVDVTAVVKSSPSSYSKSNFADLFAFTGTDNGQENPAIQTDTDPVGPFPLIAAAENSATGAKVVLVGSVSMASNGYSQAYDNLLTTINSMTWATGFQLGEFLSRTSVQSAQSLQDTPIVADESTMGTINLISFILLPFGILGLGLLVWWNSRENAQQGG
jgi:ABC-2 type transport system permease protein